MAELWDTGTLEGDRREEEERRRGGGGEEVSVTSVSSTVILCTDW